MSLKSSISSHVRISYRFYQFLTTRYTTDFYINNKYGYFLELHIGILAFIGINNTQGRALIKKRSQLEGHTKSDHYLIVQPHRTQGCRRCGA